MGSWQLEDWTRAITGLVPLAAGTLVLEQPLRRACLSILLATVAAWLVTLIGADMLHAVLLTQIQPWRIEWLVAVSGALLLPYLLVTLWRGDVAQRSAALLIVATLLFTWQLYAVAIGIGALVLLKIKPSHAEHSRLIFLGALALCALAIVWRVASNLEFLELHYLNANLPLWLRRLMSFAKDGALFGALLLVVHALGRTPRLRSFGQPVYLIAIAAITAGALRFSLGDWLIRTYPPERTASFESWRIQIPPQAQVFWNDSPLSSWALLRRSHYLSGMQSSGVVFSRTAAEEIKRRAELLAPAISPANFLEWDSINPTLPLDATALLRVCRLGIVDYLVTPMDITLVPMATMATAGSKRTLKLYRCADPR